MLFALMFVGAAQASGNYPTEVEAALAMPCVPTCMLCHADNAGGVGTVVQPFGEAMMARGLTGGGDVAALTAALDAMDAEGVDSDGDGQADVDALAEGLNPNDGSAFCDLLLPTYGCLGYTPVAPDGGRWLALAAAGLAVAASRRR